LRRALFLSPSPPPREERGGVRRPIVSKFKSPRPGPAPRLGGERRPKYISSNPFSMNRWMGTPDSSGRTARYAARCRMNPAFRTRGGSRVQCTRRFGDSEVGEHARHGRGGMRLASRTSHDVIQSAGMERFRTTHGFPRGAENSARGGRAPHSISEFGFK
jgi:hypothetical protein